MRHYTMRFNYSVCLSAKNHVEAKNELLELLIDDLQNPLLDMKENITIEEFEED